MRTFDEWQEQMEVAHSCDQSEGKIFAMSMSPFGQVKCSYCGEVVDYPHATKEELKQWMKETK